ncbi:hypothetical protein [Antrihabitans sp. YC2-6]|nr:hypothetical protein [Antrihabitans sp. YC2-6]MBJ8348903.1 hypothetical protein [Antrihabitans sp. YC2-6]
MIGTIIGLGIGIAGTLVGLGIGVVATGIGLLISDKTVKHDIVELTR